MFKYQATHGIWSTTFDSSAQALFHLLTHIAQNEGRSLAAFSVVPLEDEPGSYEIIDDRNTFVENMIVGTVLAVKVQ